MNEYGHVHQTMTFHSVDEEEVFYTGGAETRDSWFPGYSWTITYCRRCGSLLGWKFHWVGVSVGDNGVLRHTRKESEMKNTTYHLRERAMNLSMKESVQLSPMASVPCGILQIY